jgi:hypothetical protein
MVIGKKSVSFNGGLIKLHKHGKFFPVPETILTTRDSRNRRNIFRTSKEK